MAILRRMMAALKPGLSPEQEWLDACADMGGERCASYSLYQEFYDGARGAKLRDRAKLYLQTAGVPFCENFSDVVVDVLAERLSVIGFASSASVTAPDPETGKPAATDPFAALVEEWWNRNRMDGVQPVVHTQALMKGDEFVIVEWDAKLNAPRFIRQRQHQVKVVYSDDEPDTISYAVKVWNTKRVGPQNPNGKAVRRLNLYYPERVEKWYRVDSGGEGGGWEHWSDETDRVWPLPWTTTQAPDGEPLGIPIVHFRHRPLGDGHGRSRIRPAIPFQEELNKYAADLNDLIDNHALPQDYATGITGDTKFLRVPGNLWQAADPGAQFGRLDATPTSNILEAIEGVLSRMARRSRVPMHLLTGGTPPSGEALKTAESGLVATAHQCQVEFGNSWEDALMLGLRLGRVFAPAVVSEPPDDLTIEAQWANPETRSDKADLETAALKQTLGVSKHTLLGELGYDPEQEAAQRALEAEAGAAAFERVLNSPNEPA